MSDRHDPPARPPARGDLALPDLSPGQALWRGTVTALVVVLPVAVFNNVIVADGEEPTSPSVLALFALILLGGAAGGWAVIRLSSTARLLHAAGAAAAAYAIAQALGVVLRLARGDDLSWVGYPFLALLMATCGMLGGIFARRWQLQSGPGANQNGGG